MENQRQVSENQGVGESVAIKKQANPTARYRVMVSQSEQIVNKYLPGHSSISFGGKLAAVAVLERSAPPLEHCHLGCVHMTPTFFVTSNTLC